MEQVTNRLMSWASIIEENTLQQALEISRMPFIAPHCVVMPDAHHGLGCCVGLGIPTQRALIPAAVGVDIGCGMIAWRLDIKVGQFKQYGDLQQLHDRISDAIPLSAGNYNDAVYRNSTLDRIAQLEATPGITQAEAIAPNWRLQLGSLGSGNHFIEVTVDEEGYVWLFLHSGSRGVGNKLATKHIKVAQQLAKKWWIELPNPDLAYLVEGTPEFSAYYEALRWAQKFALLNREEMMLRVYNEVHRFLDFQPEVTARINCHHNYTEKETHFGKEVWMSRKGAILASEGTMGLIPGSMGDRSYVVRGRGNRLALNTAPHGAGRTMSRSQGRGKFGLPDLEVAMRGIVWGHSADFADEHPGVYKDVDQVVLYDSADLVQVVHTLKQIVNVKGADLKFARR